MLHQQTELFSENGKQTKQAFLRAKSANTDHKLKCVHGDYIKAHWWFVWQMSPAGLHLPVMQEQGGP